MPAGELRPVLSLRSFSPNAALKAALSVAPPDACCTARGEVQRLRNLPLQSGHRSTPALPAPRRPSAAREPGPALGPEPCRVSVDWWVCSESKHAAIQPHFLSRPTSPTFRAHLTANQRITTDAALDVPASFLRGLRAELAHRVDRPAPVRTAQPIAFPPRASSHLEHRAGAGRASLRIGKVTGGTWPNRTQPNRTRLSRTESNAEPAPNHWGRRHVEPVVACGFITRAGSEMGRCERQERSGQPGHPLQAYPMPSEPVRPNASPSASVLRRTGRSSGTDRVW